MKIIFCLLLVSFTTIVFGQNTANNALSFPSTKNSFLGKVVSGANIGVDYYTGTAQVSIPICNLASKVMSIPISVDYVDGRGVKVQEYASEVGLGWQLNAGGSISRVVRGFPDEQSNGYLGTGQWGQIIYTNSASPNNYTTFFQTISTTNAGILSGLSQTNDEPHADGEPDLFYVKTPFFSFQFVFDQNGLPVFSNNEGYKVIPTNFINTSAYTNSSFEVIDPSGNQFYFGNTPNSTEQATDSIFGQVPPPFITSWYLTKIISFNSQDIITFNYIAAPTNDITYNYSWTETQDYRYSPAQTITYLNTGKTTFSTPKFISSIVSNLGELDFNYTFSRLDDPNMPYLANILMKAYNPQTQGNTTSLQTYNFNYTYFNSTSSNPNLLRLQLLGITLTGNTSSTSTPMTIASFGYNTSASLPDRTLPVFDYWGFTTTMPNPIPSDIFNIIRTPNLVMAQACILNSINSLLGANYQISYALNTFNPGSGSTNVGGLCVTGISQTLSTGENIYKTYQYADANGNSYGQIYSNKYNSLQVTTTTGTPFIVYFSGSPYTISDVNGVFVGYSTVKEINQYGGYTIYNFKNFSDFSDPIQNSGNALNFLYTPNTSLSYKRGLLKSSGVYNANGNIISQTQNTYVAQTNPITNSSYGVRVVDLPTGVGPWNTYGFYSTQVENYRLTQTVHTDFDQAAPANSISTTTNYTYDPLNKRLLNNISTTDSKGQSHVQTIFHSEDIANTGVSAIPMVTTSETAAINGLVTTNNTNAVIHTVDNRNGTINQKHNSYAITQAGLVNNLYITNSTDYVSDPVNTTNTLVKQQFFNYAPSTSNVISSNSIGGKSTAFFYGYNSSYPIASIVNASSTSTYTASLTTGTATISPAGMPGSISFTVASAGTITINLNFGGAHGSSDVTFVSCTLTGPTSSSPILCYSTTGTGCGAYGGTSTILNAAPGNYTLSASVSSNNNISNQPYVSCSYPSINSSTIFTNEFFYEGFEQIGNTSSSAHTGNLSYSGSYTVPFTLPNSRSYLIQWWSYSGSVWVFNQQAYTGPITLSGQIDDVRVFPKDALITTYTYNPLVGKTSETDPSGKSVIYQYDGLNRLQTVLDQDNNVLKQYDYKYQLLPSSGSTSLVLTGVPGFSSGGPTTGQGLIYGPVGYIVTVTMSTSASPGFNIGLIVTIGGVTCNGPTQVINGTASFTFIMPPSGVVGWSASLGVSGQGQGGGGGSFSIK